jgi:dipeptidyl-peptidase-4
MTSRRTLALTFVALAAAALAQDRLAGLLDTSKTVAKRTEIQQKISLARPETRWTSGTTLAVKQGEAWVEIDAKTGSTRTLAGPPAAPERQQRQGQDHPNNRRQRPERGRQFTEDFSPDGTKRVFYRDGDLWLSDADGKNEQPVTTEGDAQKRIKYGSASWVYGEELGQRDAMGWSPDARYVWFYRFDDSMVKDYYIAMNQTGVQTELDVEAYPKAGSPNPECDLYVYEFATKKRIKVNVRPAAFDESVGHYVYNISWSPDGRELLFHRTNRWQNTMEFCAADPSTGDVRVVVREEWPASWTDNSPQRTYFDSVPDVPQQYKGKMLWKSARNGFDNFYVVDLKSGQATAVTKNRQDAMNVVRLDLAGGWLYYMAAGPENPYMLQFRRARLDGSRDELLTDPATSHSVDLSPTGEAFLDTEQTVNMPPRATLRDMTGKAVSVVGQSNIAGAIAAGFRPTERVEFTAADGKTKLYGSLQFPADFDASKRYPVIIDIYAGPESGGHSERFAYLDRKTDWGFIRASFAVRGSSGRGKEFMDAMYLKMGTTEIDDTAEAVKAIAKLPYVDASRVGITGTSYGGYSSLMCLLRYPDLFQAAVSCSSVTDWKHYDTIYTERYMRTPQANPDGYKAGSAMEYAGSLKGWLLLYYGTSDNNVHQANTHELIRALQRAGKYHEVQVGPDQGHTGLNFNRTMEFFVERLLITGPRK